MLDISVAEEACPLNLAPTASTTAALAMGDALAIVLLERRGFKAEDFARTHPGGTLGRRLLIRVGDIMRTGPEIPSVHVDTSVGDGLLEMTRKSLGITAIVDNDNRVLGVFTDGDLRRTLDQRTDVHAVTMRAVMTPGGKRVHPSDRAMAAVELLETHKITALVVVDEEQRLVGALNIHDLFRAGVM
jgi:arabinose-5-phosphate isomerase